MFKSITPISFLLRYLWGQVKHLLWGHWFMEEGEWFLKKEITYHEVICKCQDVKIREALHTSYIMIILICFPNITVWRDPFLYKQKNINVFLCSGKSIQMGYKKSIVIIWYSRHCPTEIRHVNDNIAFFPLFHDHCHKSIRDVSIPTLKMAFTYVCI